MAEKIQSLTFNTCPVKQHHPVHHPSHTGQTFIAALHCAELGKTTTLKDPDLS
jgi:hypothetical protein